MKKFELVDPPPFLHGVYVRDDFEFGKRGSESIQQPTEPTPEVSQPEESEPAQLSEMSDDDFLASLLTTQEAPPFEEAAPSAEAETHPLDEANDANPPHQPLTPEQEKLTRRERFPFNFPWIEELDLNFPNAVTFFVGENGSGKSTLLEAIAGLSGFPVWGGGCLLYTSPSPRDATLSRMPSSA